MAPVTRSARKPRTPSSRWIARVVNAFVVLALALQLTGLAHVVSDALWLTADDAAAHFFADDDDPDCPPGCPSCHHVNGGVAAPPPHFVENIGPAGETTAGELAYRSLEPSAPALDSVFRPPRCASRRHAA